MKVVNPASDYAKIDSLYRKSERIANPKDTENNQSNIVRTLAEKPDQVALATHEILSQNELRTLAALFGAQIESDYTLYGHNQVHQSNAGHLLDIRG